MQYAKIHMILFFISLLFGIASFSTTTYGGDKKQTNTWSVTVQKPKEDRKEDSQESIRQIENLPKIIWKIIPKASASEKKPLQYTVTAKSVGKSLKKVSTQIEFKSGSIIYRNGWNDPRVQYAYNISGGDMDFIKTIEAESKWDVNALWDSGKSFWLCQIHKGYNPAMQKMYRSLKTDNEKVKMCYDQYKDWVNRWVIKTRLYWFNVRNKPQNKNSFTIK